MIVLTLTIAASVALGAGAHRRWGEHVEALTRRLLDALLYVALPFITFFVLVRATLDAGAGIGIALAYVGVAIVGVLAWLAATRVLQLGPRAAGTVVIAAIMGNTTYLGLPLIAALLGSEDLGPAITFDALVSGPMFFVVAFAIAAAITTRDEPLRDRVRVFFTRNPPLLAVIAALVAPDALAPDALVDLAKAGVVALAPLGFFVLGVQLAVETRDGAPRFPPLSAPVTLVLGLRLAVAPLLLLGLSALTVDVPDAYLVQAAMPVGINMLVVAHAYNLDLPLATSAIAWSTTIAIAAGLVAATL